MESPPLNSNEQQASTSPVALSLQTYGKPLRLIEQGGDKTI